MALVTLAEVSLHLGGKALLDRAELRLERDERVALVGRNGAGKSTLLKLLAGAIAPDSGRVARQPGLRVATLEQAVPALANATTFAVIAGGLGPTGDALAGYHAVGARLAEAPEAALEAEQARLEAAITAAHGWELHRRLDEVLAHTRLDPDRPFESLSAGMKRRVLLARALVGEPDLLLLDEPTNHLDIDAIRALEEVLLRPGPTLLFVTHDRAFLERLANRIVELDRGRLSSWECGYSTYLERRQAALEAEEAQAALFDKKLAAEEVWIRQGIKARRTRNEGRVRELLLLREQRRARLDRPGRMRTELQEAERSGRLVVEAKGIAFAYPAAPGPSGKPGASETPSAPVFRGLTCSIMRGDRIGILGPNGAGKTTLLRVLLGQLAPTEGTVRQGTQLEVAYFDQLHAQLDDDKSVIQNVGGGLDTVVVGGRRRHIHGYLEDFLFDPARARSLVKDLSGGERNRVLLARLLTRPANVLVLDEPTNDLDIETIEVLEEMLAGFGGTVLLVSHDRAFLDEVVTSTLVLEGDGLVREYVGGYADAMRQRQAALAAAAPAPAAAKAAPPPREVARARKLTWKERRELDELPDRLEALERERDGLHEAMAAPGFYDRGRDEAARVGARLKSLAADLAAAYARWEELEALA